MNEYFFTFLCIDEPAEDKLIDVSSQNKESPKSLNTLRRIEFEMRVEQLATSSNINHDVFQPQLTEASLFGLTSVADMLTIDAAVYGKRLQWQGLINLVNKVNCSVLVLPEGVEINRLIMVHEPEPHSLQIAKDFLKIFNPKLAELPLSVLFNFPEDEKQTENEKFFVDYLKMAFPNIGLQLMVDDPINELFSELNADSEQALIMTGITLGKEILNCPKMVTDCKAKNSPLFIYKK